MSVVLKLQKRRKYPVAIDGQEVFVRAMLLSEQREAMKFSNDDVSLNFALGCGLLGDDGTPEFERLENETVQEFGDRVGELLADVPVDTRAQLASTIVKLTAGPTAEQLKAIAKN